MSCPTARAELVAIIYGDVDRDTRAAVTAHLAECAACAGELERLRRVLGAVTPAVVFPREAEVDWDLPVTCAAVRAELSARLRHDDGPARDEDLLDHLARCSACSAEAAAIEATLGALGNPFPEEAQVDWDAFARDTARLAQEDARAARPDNVVRGPWAPRLRRALPAAAAIVAALGLGYLAARLTPPESPQPAATLADLPAAPAPAPGVTPKGEAPAPSPAGEMADELLRRTRLELARADTSAYLSESQSVLASFTGMPVPCDGEKIDVSVESQVSSRLLRRKQLLDRDLDDVEIARARRLADEVGVLLEEIAVLQKCASPQQVQEIREMMERRQLMMRIKMLTDELNRSEPLGNVPPARGDHA